PPPYSAQFWPVASEGPRRGAGNGAIFAIGHSRIVGKLGGGRPHVARPKTRGVEGKETEGLHQRVDAAVPEAESGGSSVTYARDQTITRDMATRVVGWSYGLPHQVSSNAS